MNEPRAHHLDPLDRSQGPRLNHFDSLDPRRTALVVIDLQGAFLDPAMPAFVASARTILPATNRLAAALRKAGGRVAYTRHTVTDEGPQRLPPWQAADTTLAGFFATMRSGAPSHDLVSELEIVEDDLIIDKYRYSAFLPVSSMLDALLREAAIDTVIIAGTLTNICCESSARDAHMLGYRVFFVADATAALTDADHNATLRSMDACFADVRTTADMLALIGEEGPSPHDQ